MFTDAYGNRWTRSPRGELDPEVPNMTYSGNSLEASGSRFFRLRCVINGESMK
jgi:hypothetical protein